MLGQFDDVLARLDQRSVECQVSLNQRGGTTSVAMHHTGFRRFSGAADRLSVVGDIDRAAAGKAAGPLELKYTAKNFLIAPGTGLPVVLRIPGPRGSGTRQ